MSTPENQVPELPSSTKLITTLATVAMISGLLVVLVYEFTKPIIAENQRLATERAIFKVLPKAKSRLTFVVDQDKLVLANDKTIGELIYAGYDKQNKLVGIAINASAQGYQDTIKILYGYSSDNGCITGFDVLKSTETPGFGTKITSDEEFLANFKCLDAQVNVTQSKLANKIKTVRHGTKQHAWEIDAISGSTITSNAIGRMLNKSAQALHPVIARNLNILKQGQQ
ncbi:electron transport complex protein RnfG [Bathymodiolus platifrons methanotrophic gill symbiont]|uniref:RnfABCDGE type electron transport complex subunit G n=1 Tax=Bathymodiolus platifrons methanotrophic gill symbiont TaxID=113268 RepID=UPI000B41DD82|nr:RnfABCDGE type electron transport complex subunit G [Bathymodiolus platifrons methanotrophic gill symbiont]MCK5870984.1 RnfABCDGE type electron transport complex subunit G [Methyloprofundus sp.]TXK96547.1 FMN-binding protein [Methylococcaceae bacterium CS4]TXK98016.1 FMN-binding protein [Methylococcaceae bacterium HT1]TXK98929.1 FMN-binding protein [Methylococcaceae bacterium CS5]TXL06828.1 FMN-binding protein [Methylococcaceae bacterium CS3]TXL07580.1 FMN-binding protein [Methylococcaceae